MLHQKHLGIVGNPQSSAWRTASVAMTDREESANPPSSDKYYFADENGNLSHTRFGELLSRLTQQYVDSGGSYHAAIEALQLQLDVTRSRANSVIEPHERGAPPSREPDSGRTGDNDTYN